MSREDKKKRALENAQGDLRLRALRSHRRDLRQDRLRVPELGMSKVGKAADEMRRRVPTAELNRFFRDVLERQPPPTHQNRSPRIYYITQARVSPPLFVAVANYPEAIKESYQALRHEPDPQGVRVRERADQGRVPQAPRAAATTTSAKSRSAEQRRSAITRRRGEVVHFAREHGDLQRGRRGSARSGASSRSKVLDRLRVELALAALLVERTQGARRKLRGRSPASESARITSSSAGRSPERRVHCG